MLLPLRMQPLRACALAVAKLAELPPKLSFAAKAPSRRAAIRVSGPRTAAWHTLLLLGSALPSFAHWLLLCPDNECLQPEAAAKGAGKEK